MKRFVSARSALALVVSTLLAFAGGMHAQIPEVDIDVKKAGGTKGDSTEPHNPTEKTITKTSALGNANLVLHNKTGQDATDVHVRVVSSEDALINSVSIGHANWSEAHPTALPAGEAGAEADETWHEIPDQDSIDFNVSFVRIVSTDPLTYEDVGNEKVVIEVWFTAGNDNEVIHAVSPHTVGDVDDGDAITSVGIPSFDDEVVTADTEATSVALGDIAIAERHGFRFQNGNLLIKPSEGLSFTGLTGVTLLAYHQDGNAAPAGDIELGPARIDDMGNLVFSVERRPADPEHVIIVVRGATIATPNGGLDGDEIYIGVQCSALAGFVLEDFKQVAVFEEEE